MAETALCHAGLAQRCELGQARLRVGYAQQRRLLQAVRQRIQPLLAFDYAYGVELLGCGGNNLVGVGAVAVHLAVYLAAHLLFDARAHYLERGDVRAHRRQEVGYGLALFEVVQAAGPAPGLSGLEAQLPQQRAHLPAHRRVGGGQLQVVALGGVGHAPARQEGAAHKARPAAVVFEHAEVYVQRERVIRFHAEGAEHRGYLAAVGYQQGLARAGRARLRQLVEAHPEGAAEQPRQQLYEFCAACYNPYLPRRKAVAIEGHAVGLGHGAALFLPVHAAQLSLGLG